MKIPKTFARDLRTPEHTPGQRCQDINWVNREPCERTTNWTCGECGRPVCSTHAHWHHGPDSKKYGPTACVRTYSTVWANRRSW